MIGKTKLHRKNTKLEHPSSVDLQTAGGCANMRSDASRAAIPLEQLVFFIEVLTLTAALRSVRTLVTGSVRELRADDADRSSDAAAAE